jgi:hypothetical protein
MQLLRREMTFGTNFYYSGRQAAQDDVPGSWKISMQLDLHAVAYNLVRRVMVEAGQRQHVEPNRISFVDALRWLRQAEPGEELPRLKVNPDRPGRVQPRARKRRPKSYKLLNRPRAVLQQALLKEPPEQERDAA